MHVPAQPVDSPAGKPEYAREYFWVASREYLKCHTMTAGGAIPEFSEFVSGLVRARSCRPQVNRMEICVAMHPRDSATDQTTSTSVHELEENTRSGSVEALAKLFDLYHPRLLRIVDARMDDRLRSRVDPADLLQETFLELTKKLPAYVEKKSDMSLFVWMRLVAVERVVVAYRRHVDAAARDVRREAAAARLQGHSSVMLADRLLCRFSSIGRKAIREEMAETLMRTLGQMQEIDHEIITMRCFEDLSNAEAAQSLNISENGASSRFVRAMTRLKAELSKIPGFDD